MRPSVVRIVSIVLVPALLTGCSVKTPTTTGTPRPIPSPTLGPVSVHASGSRNHPVSIVVTGQGRRLYTVDALRDELVRTTAGTYNSKFFNPHLVFYQKDGGRLRATARTADVDGADKIVNMHDEVHLLTQDGTLLTCDQLTYDQVTGRIHGTGHVHVRTRSGDTLSGDVLDGDVRLRNVRVRGNGGT